MSLSAVPRAMVALALLLGALVARPGLHAQVAVPGPPPDAGNATPETTARRFTATLLAAPPLEFPSDADSNSPAVWALVDGRLLLHLTTSVAGAPSRAIGTRVNQLQATDPVAMTGMPAGVWMEAIVPDADGTWYGFYHNEVTPAACAGTDKMSPRIGAARSIDRGASWQDLGVILESPGITAACDTPNRYFTHGVGDFSVVLDADGTDLHFFFSQYTSRLRGQGVGVARLPWADRDAPVGRISVWREGVWQPAKEVALADGSRRWIYPIASPIYRAAESWHDGDEDVDAFWGPAVHWNTGIGAYVMLLNRARDVKWQQEGIYVSFAETLDDPGAWSAPEKVLDGGRWYPQVIGLEAGVGTDKLAAGLSRFFMSGRSEHLIRIAEVASGR